MKNGECLECGRDLIDQLLTEELLCDDCFLEENDFTGIDDSNYDNER